MFTKKSHRSDNRVNAGSMADIAFLLLIFFLVTTTILNESGITVKLPPWDTETDPPPVPPRNVLNVKLNAQNELMVENEQTDVKALRALTKQFILNPQNDPNLARSPKKAVISLQNDRSTHYATYLAVYNELKAAYHEIWDAAAKKQYGYAFDQLPKPNQKEIRNTYPMVISEAEPTEY
jgi:biopolymer transport protein ExbD